MEPLEFIYRTEAMNINLFESYNNYRIAAGNTQKVFIPQQQYYAYISEHRSFVEGYNDETHRNCIAKIADAQKALLLANVAAGAVAGAILQVARQCISLAWPTSDERMNKGRLVGSQHLSCVIWHARNQALHFEEGIPRNKNTHKSIKLLSNEFLIPIENLDTKPRALSVEIFDVLGWNKYESYAKDMVDMLREI